MTYVIQLLSAFTGSLGFALLFNVKRRNLLLGGLGGALAWGIYLLAGFLSPDDVFRFFVASMGLTLWAEWMARARKAPATVFLVSASIPLIPGGSLYTTMQYAIWGQWDQFTASGLHTLLLAGAIAAGMLCMMAILHVIGKIVRTLQTI